MASYLSLNSLMQELSPFNKSNHYCWHKALWSIYICVFNINVFICTSGNLGKITSGWPQHIFVSYIYIQKKGNDEHIMIRLQDVGLIWFDFRCFNATFSNISAISWWPVLVLEEARIPGENHQPWASNW